MAVNTGIGPVLAHLLHPVHDNPTPPTQVGWVSHGIILKLLKWFNGIPYGEEFGCLELVLVAEPTMFIWIGWKRSLLKVLLGEAMVVSEYGNVVGAASDEVGLRAMAVVEPHASVWMAVLAAAVAARLWVVWSMWSSMQNCLTDPRAFGIPWHWRAHLGWLLWKRDIACARGEDVGSIGEGIEVVEQSVDCHVADDRAAPRTCVW